MVCGGSLSCLVGYEFGCPSLLLFFFGFLWLTLFFPSSFSSSSFIVYTGEPMLQSYFFHRTVPASIGCTSLGFSFDSDAGLAAPSFARRGVCRIWYPNSELSGLVLQSLKAAPCDDSEPYIRSLACTTTCPDNCISCSTSQTCTVCASGFIVGASGQCVAEDNCEANFFANPEAGRCEG